MPAPTAFRVTTQMRGVDECRREAQSFAQGLIRYLSIYLSIHPSIVRLAWWLSFSSSFSTQGLKHSLPDFGEREALEICIRQQHIM